VVSEVTSVSEQLVGTVMSQVVENVCEEFTRLFSCIAKFCDNGSLQATLDIASFQDPILPFLNQHSRVHLSETFNLIPKSKELLKSSRRIQALLDEHNRKTRLQLICFKLENGVS